MAKPDEPVARYFPLSSGQYAIRPGFYRLGHDFGNRAADNRVFQLDRQFAGYRLAKQAACAENPDKYLCFTAAGRAREPSVSRFLIDRLCYEYPAYFQLSRQGVRQQLDCRLTGESLHFTRDGRFLGAPGHNKAQTPAYTGGMDALALQIPEDLALIHLSDEQDHLCAIHLCQPNHWDPREKIGRNFSTIHQPVPDMARINTRARQLLQACLYQGPFVRFAWGVATDDRLNHHPEAPPGFDQQLWAGRQFDITHPAAWLRVERQVLSGLPDINAVLFTIRTYLYPVTKLSTHEQRLLHEAIAGMQPHHLVYKGLPDPQPLLTWLRSLYEPS